MGASESSSLPVSPGHRSTRATAIRAVPPGSKQPAGGVPVEEHAPQVAVDHRHRGPPTGGRFPHSGEPILRVTEQAAFDEFNQWRLVLARRAPSGVEPHIETLAEELKALGRMLEVQHLDKVPNRREIQHTFDRLAPFGVNDIGR